jgi:hypothetical protein
MATIEMLDDPYADLTILKVHGAVILQDIMDVFEEYYDGPVANLVLWDFTDGTIQSLTMQEIRQFTDMAKYFCATQPSRKSAMVFSSLSDYGMGRMIEAMATTEGHSIAIMPFKDMPSARVWLGLSL